MKIRIGILTVQAAGAHANSRLLEASRAAGHVGVLLHPYRWWPHLLDGRLAVAGEADAPLPHVLIPRQGAQIGESSLALLRQFQALGIPMVNGQEAITIARDKWRTHQTLALAGLPCPNTVLINDPEAIDWAADRLGGYPVVAKPSSGHQGDGVRYLADAKDARQQLAFSFHPRAGLMIQQYLPPVKRRDIRVLVVNGQCIAAVGLTPPAGDFRANFHLGSQIEALQLSAGQRQLALRAAAAVGCDIAGVDLMVDAKGQAVIVEVNYSPGFKGLEAATGLDIATTIVQAAVDRFNESAR